jgi:hypothetical protein
VAGEGEVKKEGEGVWEAGKARRGEEAEEADGLVSRDHSSRVSTRRRICPSSRHGTHPLAAHSWAHSR